MAQPPGTMNSDDLASIDMLAEKTSAKSEREGYLDSQPIAAIRSLRLDCMSGADEHDRRRQELREFARDIVNHFQAASRGNRPSEEPDENDEESDENDPTPPPSPGPGL